MRYVLRAFQPRTQMTITSVTPNESELRAALAQRDALIAALRVTIDGLQAQNAALQSTLVNHAHENELLKRRLFGIKSERSNTHELQLTLGDLLAQQQELQKQLDALTNPPPEPPAPPTPPAPQKPRPAPKGRRDLSVSNLPTTRVDIHAPALEETGKLIGWEESHQLMRIRGGFHVLVKRLAKYEVKVDGESKVLGALAPEVLFPRALLHPSALAWLVVQKFALGVPCHRLEQHLAAQGEPLSRSTMCRNLEEVGNTLGATVVHAMMRDAIEHCQVLSTDATGAAIQPVVVKGGPKQACKKGHFFTIVADCDHVLFSYAERHTQDAVASLFQGFRGLLQSDASSVYDILERGPRSWVVGHMRAAISLRQRFASIRSALKG